MTTPTFRPKCPKCNSNVSVFREPDSGWSAYRKIGDAVLHCKTCGKQMFGEAVEKELQRQLDEWNTNRLPPPPPPVTHPPPPPPQSRHAERTSSTINLEAMNLYELRSYAALQLKIKGASKIPGGRPVLLEICRQALGESNSSP